MKAIILCAGRGVRLRDLTGDEIPKCLVKVNGKAIIDWQIDAMNRSGIEDITIVTGFKADKIKEKLSQNKHIAYVHNDKYATTNILTSLWVAFKEPDCNENLAIMAGDVVFDPDILKKMVLNNNSDILIAADSKKIDAEAVKIKTQKDSVLRFGKDLKIEDSQGQFLGLMTVYAGAVKEMKDLVKKMITEEDCSNSYLFDMLNTMIERYKKNVGYFDIGEHFWEEIDFKEDWERANKFFRSK